MKKLLSFTMTLIICLTAVFAAGCDLFGIKTYQNWFIDSSDSVRKRIVTDVDSVSVVPSATVQVHADIVAEGQTPTFSDIYQIYWSSENESVATVSDDGVITGVRIGRTKVFASISPSQDVKAVIVVNVVKKELTGIRLENCKTVYTLGTNFTPSFNCIAIFSDAYEEEILVNDANLTVNSSAYNKSQEGSYTIYVYYDYGSKRAEASYTVEVVEEISYDAKYLDYTYADLKKSNRTSFVKTSYCPSSGEINYLVIPVYFTNSSQWISASNKSTVKNRIQQAFFGTPNETNGWNSVQSFYETASDGKLSINGIVTEWYEPAYNTDHYGSDSNHISNLAVEAVDWYFMNNPGESRTDYDSDHNGIIDAVALVFGCPNYTDSSIPDSYKSFWAMVTRGNFQTPNVLSPKVSCYLWASYTETTTDTRYCTADSHTYIHETGHLFGLEDYYDYGGNYWPTGGFVTMELNTGSHDPFSCLALGWAKAIIPEESCQIELNDFQSSHEVVILSNNPHGFNSPFDEYIILELYSPTGLNKFDCTYKWQNSNNYPKGVSTVGIRIWHIDARLTRYVSNAYTTTLHTDPTVNNSETAFTNSWNTEGRISPLGANYQDYSLVFGLRNNFAVTYKPTSTYKNFTSTSLLTKGGTFSPSQNVYKNQFKNNGKMNDGSTFKWTVNVGTISTNTTGYSARLTLTMA